MGNLNQLEFEKLINCGIINETYVQECIQKMKIEEMLKKHSYKITESKDGYWRTYVKDATKLKGNRLIKKTTKDKLYETLIKYYENENNQVITFNQMYNMWRSVQDQLVSHNTVYKYNTDYKRFFENKDFILKPINKISEDDLKIFFFSTINDNKLTKGAFKKLYGYVSNTFDKAFRERIIDQNPMIYFVCKQFYKYCYDNDKDLSKQVFSEEEQKLILNLLHEQYEIKPDYIPNYAIEFAYLTGMRVGEIVALKWEDVFFDKNFFVINKSEKYDRMTKSFYIDSTKNKKIRKFPIDPAIKKLLIDLRKCQMKFGFVSEWIFSNETGRIHSNIISSCIKNKCKMLNIPPRGIHTFRKTLNSNLRCAGISDVIASSLLGHSLEVNREYYTFDVSTMQEKADIIKMIHG